jgi:hypothetical protein
MICMTHPSIVAGILATILWGVVCFVLAQRFESKKSRGAENAAPGSEIIGPQKSAKDLVIIVLIVMSSVVLVRAHDWVTWDPIGESSDNGWGWPGCWRTEQNSTPSGQGMVATVRATVCPGAMAGDYATYVFVFVGAVDHPAGRTNLVFRYEGSPDNLPRVAWTSPSTLKIVARGDIIQVTKQQAEGGGVHINYSLARATFPPALEFWQRSF